VHEHYRYRHVGLDLGGRGHRRYTS
jgi:hypothetical protein